MLVVKVDLISFTTKKKHVSSIYNNSSTGVFRNGGEIERVRLPNNKRAAIRQANCNKSLVGITKNAE